MQTLSEWRSVEKLPAGFAYPVKRTVLQAGFDAVGLQRAPRLRFYRQRKHKDVLWAWFPSDIGRGVDRPSSGHVQLFIYAVPSDQRSRIEQELIANVLPSLCRWLKEVETAENVWRATSHDFHVVFDEQTVSVVKD